MQIMSGRHLKQLFRAHREGDDLAFRRVAQEIIAEEEAKHHLQLARELRGLLASGGTTVGDWVPLPSPPRDADSNFDLMTITTPKRLLTSVVLPSETQRRVRGLLTEVEHWPDLDRHGVPRRQRILLYGPPGCGKSTTAAAIAAELGYPLATVQLDAVVSSLLGETASNLRRAFDFAQANPVVLLLDEFDVFGRERGDPNDHGELRRIVNAVLQLMAAFQGPSLIIAATNHAEDLDPAAWRRFDEVLMLPPPDAKQVEAVLRRTLGETVGARVDLAARARTLVGLPHAAAESVGWEAKRLAVLNGRRTVTARQLDDAIAVATTRRWT